jgi:hypothetical protein
VSRGTVTAGAVLCIDDSDLRRIARIAGAMAIQTCYACHKPATTREHAPPQSFFPESYRKNLITVPSCDAHNNAYAKDVEYTKAVIVSGANLGLESKGVFDSSMRAIERRPALAATIYPEITPLIRNGEEVGYFAADLTRVNRVISAIAAALHFRDLKVKRKAWNVFCPTMHSDESIAQGTDKHDTWRLLLLKLKYEYVSTPHPKVFTYGRAVVRKRHVYQLIFYDTVIFNAWPKGSFTVNRRVRS